MKTEVVKEKGYLTFEEIVKLYDKEPPITYLWSGIIEKSIGMFFAPPKSGKSTLCECLGMHLAVGRKEFMGFELDGKPRKIMFIGLEESWIMRVRRNKSQYQTLTEPEKLLYNSNYTYQPTEYLRLVSNDKDWARLKKTIKDSGAEIVFIDSITRLNHGSLEKSSDAEKIMLKLRNLCLDLKITLICIHHTPKIGNRPLTMDCMKGSVVFAQEADFIIGLRNTNNKVRYLKNIEFRYKEVDDSVIHQFKFTQNSTIDYQGTNTEYELLEATDGRRADNHRDVIIKKIKELECKALSTSDLVTILKKELGIEERQIKSLLSDLVESKLINRPKRGFYSSVNCTKIDFGDEEE
ncbi:AAA family ATPase [Algibacter sp. 2305UL17-15]|uniref:AAA family ATPase n=1 Tax=Algibacter sp. 2305UL17-15 TaxID=3231268 RepID=UPI0034586185